MGFSESFIAGYTHGINAKRAKEQGALAREQFEEHKAEAAQRFKLDSDEAKARRDQQTLNEKLALINIQKMTPAALPDLSKSGGMGPPQESDMPAPPPSIGLDVAGQHLDIPGTNLEAEQARALEHQRAVLETAASVKEQPDVVSPETEQFLTGQKPTGRKFTPTDVKVLGEAAKSREDLNKIRLSAALDPMKAFMARMLGNQVGGPDHTPSPDTTVTGDTIPPFIKAYTDTGHFTGHPFIDSTRIPKGKVGDAINMSASQNGIPVVSKEDATAVRQLHSVSSSLDDTMAQLESKLPKGPGGRVIDAPLNKLSQFFQTDPELGAFKVWRDNAFQLVRSLGVSGRMNIAEINQAISNIPDITDTLGVARQKVANFKTLAGNKEVSILGGNLIATTPDGKRWKTLPDGRHQEVP